MPSSKNQRIAIVHDWLIGGGAEKVVDALHQMFPEAQIYTSYSTDEWRRRLDNKVVTGYLQSWPFSKLRKFIPFLRGWWFSRLDLSNYDLIISSSGAEAKFVKVHESSRHIAYIHAPTHYYWSRYDEYMKHPGFKMLNPLARLGLKLLVGPMRRWDYRAAQRPDQLIANSTYTQSKIKEYYKRDSVVIHPPVNVGLFAKEVGKHTRDRFLIAGRQTPYKRVDLAVQACTKLNLPLTVIGTGPEHDELIKIAGPSIKFVTNATDEQLPTYFASAKAFIFPGIDDFGIVAVEALASGTPVIAYQDGGALDYVIPAKTGEFFKQSSEESLVDALKSFNVALFNPATISNQSQAFGSNEFKNKMLKVLG